MLYETRSAVDVGFHPDKQSLSKGTKAPSGVCRSDKNRYTSVFERVGAVMNAWAQWCCGIMRCSQARMCMWISYSEVDSMFSGSALWFRRGSVAACSDSAPGQYICNLAGMEGGFKQGRRLKGLRLASIFFLFFDSGIPKLENVPGSTLPLKRTLPQR